jgi:hypothetical protein
MANGAFLPADRSRLLTLANDEASIFIEAPRSSAYQPRFDLCGLLLERGRRVFGRGLVYEFQFRGSLTEIALGDGPNPAQDGVSALLAAACHSSSGLGLGPGLAACSHLNIFGSGLTSIGSKERCGEARRTLEND